MAKKQTGVAAILSDEVDDETKRKVEQAVCISYFVFFFFFFIIVPIIYPSLSPSPPPSKKIGGKHETSPLYRHRHRKNWKNHGRNTR